ncbi:MAG: stage II sporulation protein M [Candidatus Eremiobacteraeota bacterium]|nr:stage II sporulation protein M [Candidatus Eremiobacteraeota bacterium]
MISKRWLARRQAHWERLENLLDAAERGLRRLNGRELQELGLLYRQTASDLAAVVEDRSSARYATYLNQLLGRCHNFLYAAGASDRNRLIRFYLVEYPRIFRECFHLFLIASALLAIGAIAGWAATTHDPAFAHRFLGPKMMDTIEQRKMWTEPVIAIKPIASSFITTNNLSVAFSLFALGITGIGTVWLLFFNGLMLGVIATATANAGMALSLWSFVAPHGVLEIPAILMAGAAGLEVARGILFPGLLPRRDALSQAGTRAVRLLVGSIPLLLVAGIVEGFFSPTHVAPALKFTLAGLLLTALVLYLSSRLTFDRAGKNS